MSAEVRERSPGPGDLGSIASLVRLAERTDMGVDLRSGSHILSDARADRFELSRDARLIVDVNGAASGFAWLFETLPHSELEGELYVDPASRGRGLEARLLAWLEKRSREHAQSALSGVSLTLACLAHDQAMRTLFRRAGFVKLRDYLHLELVLERSPDPSDQRHGPRPLPDGVVVRDFRLPGDARPVFEALTQAFMDEFRPGEESFGAWRSRTLARDDADTGLWVVASHNEEIIGAVTAFVEEGAGYVADVGVRPAWRRKGVASAMLVEAFARLRARGCARVWLSVDAQNPTGAVAVYEGVGMRPVRRFELFEKRYRKAPSSGPGPTSGGKPAGTPARAT